MVSVRVSTLCYDNRDSDDFVLHDDDHAWSTFAPLRPIRGTALIRLDFGVELEPDDSVRKRAIPRLHRWAKPGIHVPSETSPKQARRGHLFVLVWIAVSTAVVRAESSRPPN
jgi:hypothetical protein